jgi:hypothetical protein
VPVHEVQRKPGTLVADGGTTTALDAAATAGNLLLVFVATSGAIGTPSGFTSTGPTPTQARLFRKVAAGGETTVTFPATGTTRIYSYLVVEAEGVDAAYPVDVAATTAGGANTGAGNILRSSVYDGAAVALWGTKVTGNTTVPTASAHTNDFVEQHDAGATDGTDAVGLSVAWRPVQSLAQWASLVTLSAGTAHSFVVVLAAEGSHREPNIGYFWGFSNEVASYPTYHAVSPSGARYWETQAGTPTIDSDGLRLQAAVASEQWIVGNGQSLTEYSPRAALGRVRFRLNGTLPGNNLELCQLVTSTGTHATLRYRPASQKLGLQVGSGTEQLSDQTVSADVWVDLDVRLNCETTAFTADWRLQYDGGGWVGQTQAAGTSGGVPSGYDPLLGWAATRTGDVSYRYAVFSQVAAHHPLGDYGVAFVGPDTTSTPVVLGSDTSFRRFTANGTLDDAYEGPAILEALDDWPPTFGASADGLAVVAADASGIRLPMASYDAAAGGVSVRAVRAVAPLWAASTAAATIGLQGWYGTATTPLYGEADPNADTSTTPPWVAKMFTPTNRWDQTRLDAAAVEVWSTDPNPIIGLHAVGLETLHRIGEPALLFGAAGAVPRIEQTYDPDSYGLVQLHAYTGDLGLEVTYEVDGAPVGWSVPPNSNPATRTLDADDMATVNRLVCRPADP